MDSASVQARMHVCVTVVARLLRATGREDEGRREGGRRRYFSLQLSSYSVNLHIFLFPYNMCNAVAFVQCYQQDAKCVFVHVRRACLDVLAGTRGFYMREREGDRQTGREGGSIPAGIQTASVLCDQDEDDFIRPASVSLSPLFLSLSGCK